MKYNQSPLPFQGQKRRFNTEFKSALTTYFSDCTLFIDLFGGSGLLSQWVKETLPNSIVIYNDYDLYSKRISNIKSTNELLSIIRAVVRDVPKDKLIPTREKQVILAAIKTEEIRSGYVDYITISSNLLFSMNYATNFDDLSKQSMYNVVRRNDYQTADDYLSGVDVVCMDYRELFDRYSHVEDVVFLIDPPYLSTDCGTYGNYWRLSNYLDVLHTLQNTNYFYFTSDKSSIIELTEWMRRNLNALDPFDGAKRVDIATTLNRTAGYTDIMLYKHK